MSSNLTFRFYKQPDAKDCGPTCLRIIAKYYGKLISLQEIREYSETTRSGSNLLKLSEAAESIGFKTIGARPGIKYLINKFVLYLI
ncbi:cysteine peptidase family C39 domain-containing protein [Cyclobacterium sp. SYSU L10401]|uniref:cysteine peptidase family C39 domain-containing protein n=1 Tax=Cyclobacterium sp. SYSU L10401 TaxID=2678657 RepID=UPI0013D05FAC|nr:cysteine peptidase family C39 domain-containing protein [Cyclobacterium sp. SYSU L10401]